MKRKAVRRRVVARPVVIASNTTFTESDPTLVGLQRLAKEDEIRGYMVINRGGIRFGIIGLLGKEAVFYTDGADAVKFADPIETAKEMVKTLRDMGKVDIIIALSHGGMTKGEDGRFFDGEDVQLSKAVPGIDISTVAIAQSTAPEKTSACIALHAP